MDFEKLAYYVNQGGPGVWIAAAYILYTSAPKVVSYCTDLLNTLKMGNNLLVKQETLLETQNELLSKFIEKVNK